MNKEKTGGAAFPTNQNGQLHHSCTQDGMTLLDYFAAKFVAAEIAKNKTGIPSYYDEKLSIARRAYSQASAMLDVREEYI